MNTSSSYMLAMALIEDRDKFDKWLSSNENVFFKFMNRHYESNPFIISKVKDLEVDNGEIVVSNKLGKSLSISVDDIDVEELVFLNYHGNEGEDAFEDNGYHIDISFLPYEEQVIYNGFSEENGLKNIQKEIGAVKL
jgi:hypothetical protein